MPDKHQNPTSESSEWNASLRGNLLWSNVNFGEAITNVMTPLTWSIIQFTLDDWIFIPGFPTVDQICGYPYLNISVFATLFQMLGRGQDDLLKYMESTLYMKLPEEVSIPRIPLSARGKAASLWYALQVQRKQQKGVKGISAYLEKNTRFFNRIRALIEGENDKSSLLNLWNLIINPHIKGGVWCVLGTATYSSDYTMKLQRELLDLVGPEDAQHLIANISDPSDLLPSLGPVIGLDKVARGEWSRAYYLEHYGHRGPQEFELSFPRPAEDPAWLETEIAQLKDNPQNSDERILRQKENFEAAWRRLTTHHPRKAISLRRRIDESARRNRLRELARSAYVRDRWLIRLFALRVADLHGLEEDIFFLTLDEALGLLKGADYQSDKIENRKSLYNQAKSLPPYPSVISGPFDPFQWAVDPDRRTDIYTPEKLQDPIDSQTITGSPGSAGQVVGQVRCLSHPDVGESFQKGEILVAVQTDISWTLLFPRAAAVITDVGAPLSHAAIVARELGIPAVVGCGNAMQRLKTGDRVRVDGGRGTVSIISQTDR